MRELTIYDIAKMANVSASTVSRVINQKPGVKKSTRARVLKYLNENNFVPNATARGLVNQTSRMIGILLSDIRTTHHTDEVYHIERELSKSGYCCLIFNTGTDENEQVDHIRILSQRNVDAAILMGSIYQSEAISRAIAMYLPTTPTFICNGYLNAPNIYGIIADERSGVADCVRLLTERGRQNLAFVIDHDTPSNRLKLQGFMDGVARYCGDAPPVVIWAEPVQSGSYTATTQLMNAHPETNGIIYAVDLLAVIGMHALSDMGLTVPERMAVVGIDNSLYSEISSPKLTSLDNMRYDLSLIVARNLISVLQGDHINHRMLIYTEIVEREST